MKRLMAMLIVLSATLVPGLPASSSTTALAKCKGSDHLGVIAADPGDTLVTADKVEMVRIDVAECKNDLTYPGPVYAFKFKAKVGLRMYPEAAVWVREQFRAASGSVALEHKLNGVLTPYRSFDDEARAKIVVELDELNP